MEKISGVFEGVQNTTGEWVAFVVGALLCITLLCAMYIGEDDVLALLTWMDENGFDLELADMYRLAIDVGEDAVDLHTSKWKETAAIGVLGFSMLQYLLGGFIIIVGIYLLSGGITISGIFLLLLAHLSGGDGEIEGFNLLSYVYGNLLLYVLGTVFGIGSLLAPERTIEWVSRMPLSFIPDVQARALLYGWALIACGLVSMGGMACGWMLMGIRASAHANLIVENAFLLAFGVANLAYMLPFTIPLGGSYALLSTIPSVLVILNSGLGATAIVYKSMFLLQIFTGMSIIIWILMIASGAVFADFASSERRAVQQAFTQDKVDMVAMSLWSTKVRVWKFRGSRASA